MRSKLLVAVAALIFTLPSLAQVRPEVEKSPVNLSIGGGLDWWTGDWGGSVKRFGPSAWATAEIWHGLGINAEGHTMIFGGSVPSDRYKYFVGEGGAIYNYHHWRTITPYAKVEWGFASLSFPTAPNSPTKHNTRDTKALGGGVEYRIAKHIWTRVDYTYDFFPDFYNAVTGNKNDLNPEGVAFGATYHFR
jgi:opacity protein-like surface antigen